jgi:hypothetical protein
MLALNNAVGGTHFSTTMTVNRVAAVVRTRMKHKRALARCRRRVVAPVAPEVLQARCVEWATDIVRCALGAGRVLTVEVRRALLDNVNTSTRDAVSLCARGSDPSGHPFMDSTQMGFWTTESAKVWEQHGSAMTNGLATDHEEEGFARTAGWKGHASQPAPEKRCPPSDRELRCREDEFPARQQAQRRAAAPAATAARQRERVLATKEESLRRREAELARNAVEQQMAFLQREAELAAKESEQRKEAERLEALHSTLSDHMNQDARRREADIMANEEQRRRAVELDEAATREDILRRVTQSELALVEATLRLGIESLRNRKLRCTERCMAAERKLAAVSHVVAMEGRSRCAIEAAWLLDIDRLVTDEQLHRTSAAEAATRRRIRELELKERTARRQICQASEGEMEYFATSAATRRRALANILLARSAAARRTELGGDEAFARTSIVLTWQRSFDVIITQLANLSWSEAVATSRQRRAANMRRDARAAEAAAAAAARSAQIEAAAQLEASAQREAELAARIAAQRRAEEQARSYAPPVYYYQCAPQMDWNSFQAAHRGQGYTSGSGRNSLSQAYARYKR